MTWQPLFLGDEVKPFQEKLAEIAEVMVKIRNSEDLKKNIGLMGGKIGFSLFFFYYAMYTQNDQYAEYGVELISDIFDEINNEFSYHTHAGGLAGIGWSIELLAKNEFIDTDTNEVLEALDPYLHKTMVMDMTNGNYDYLHGALGNGLYFLSRQGNPKSKEYLAELIDLLEKGAQREEDGSLKWESELNHEDGMRGFNVSLSHGIASIIYFLGKMLEAGIYKEKVAPVLDGAVKFLLKNRLEPGKYKSVFPSWVVPGQPETPSRLAWCYGDLGVGTALWQAARITGNKEWEKIAEDALLLSTNRRDIRENTVIDAGLCHGGAGIAHVYARAWNYMHHDIFKETARYWADVALKQAAHKDGYAGYKAWHTEKYGGWICEPGFLEGISGIGLCFISLISEIEPHWDRSLCLS